MSNTLKIGFIGFGEAGYHLAKGLRGEGLTHLSAYDIHSRTPGRGEKIRTRAADANVALVESPEDLVRSSDLLFSVVTASSAVEAAGQNAPFLQARHYYADLNSVSPETKRAIELVIVRSQGRFVEAAVMAPVPRYGHRVPMLLGGRHACGLADLLGPVGMRMEVISDEVGRASAVKMCRSILVKGLEALMLECLLGATRYGVDEQVFASLDESFPGMDWNRQAGYLASRVLEHGERRAREMEEVGVTLRDVGVEPIMSEATVRRQDWGGRLKLFDYFGGKIPEDYRMIAKAIAERGSE